MFPTALRLMDGELQADLHQEPAEGSTLPAEPASEGGKSQPAGPSHEPCSGRAAAQVGLALTSK